MQAIMETLFDIVYLTLVITIGIRMMIKGRKERQYFLFGVMAVILGMGDAFHLLPRAYALCTTGLENFTAALGVGKLVTSVTMTVFYVLLYYVWRIRYHVQGGNGLSACICLLAASRIVLCLFPQNEWTSADAVPMIGMLMIPKTCAYVWAVLTGYYDMKRIWTSELGI